MTKMQQWAVMNARPQYSDVANPYDIVILSTFLFSSNSEAVVENVDCVERGGEGSKSLPSVVFSCSFELMTTCWLPSSADRPPFSRIVDFLLTHGKAESSSNALRVRLYSNLAVDLPFDDPNAVCILTIFVVIQ